LAAPDGSSLPATRFWRHAALTLLIALPVVPSIAFGGGTTIAPGNLARDGDVAVTEEFRAAEMSATAAAWRLFIARNPHHTLAREARRRLRAVEPK